ncbi:MAG: DUF2948 family protein [Parvibaculaceae bacterium]
MELLRLTALDEEDLAVISANLQDAILKADDVAYLPGERKLAMIVNRFNWIESSKQLERRRTGFRMDRVTRVSRLNFTTGDTVHSLLAILFHPAGEPPAGTIELVFSGGMGLKADVECIEVTLEDLGPAWETRRMPAHSDG